VILILTFFQLVVIKEKIQQIRKVVLGVFLVIIGLTFFLIGLEKALFPIGNMMAVQLSSHDFISQSYSDVSSWKAYYWIYIFAFFVGFSTTIAEPSLIAVAFKANEISGGKIGKLSLRMTVALGVGMSLVVGTLRIVIGSPIYLFILGGYIVVVILTIFTPKNMIALAYDSGGVTTSTVTVPIVAALGLGLASVVPDRNPALDGFGLIAFANIFAVMSVLIYALVIEFLSKINKK